MENLECCGIKSTFPICYKNLRHEISIKKFPQCRCKYESKGCTLTPKTIYRTAYKKEKTGYKKVYTIKDWSDNMFNYYI